MTAVDPRTGIEVLDRDECLQLLATETVGRVVVVDHGSPHIVPVNYALDGDAVVFRTAIGTKFDAASRSDVAFEVDAFDSIDRRGWSVVVHGWAQEVTAYDDLALLARVNALAIEQWATFEKPHILRIVSTSITGRRVAPPGRPPKSQELLHRA
jgi:nitroimidazol reductase NimA-like FMN-containing flavoprotein (pyridoxamine 5'-phosphate oxidase superfamily)